MKSPATVGPPLAYAAEIAFELCLLRDECCQAARAVVGESPLDEVTLEECAQLDDALAKAHRLLQGTLKTIHRSRMLRKGRAR